MCHDGVHVIYASCFAPSMNGFLYVFAALCASLVRRLWSGPSGDRLWSGHPVVEWTDRALLPSPTSSLPPSPSLQILPPPFFPILTFATVIVRSTCSWPMWWQAAWSMPIIKYQWFLPKLTCQGYEATEAAERECCSPQPPPPHTH